MVGHRKVYDHDAFKVYIVVHQVFRVFGSHSPFFEGVRLPLGLTI